MRQETENVDPNWLGEEDIYKENILDHYKNPHNFGSLENPTFSNKENNPLCGDQIEIFVNTKDNEIKEIKFQGNGCAISMASASMLTEKVKGMSIEEGVKLAVRCIKASMLREPSVGEGIDIYVVKKGEIKQISAQEASYELKEER